ncbi:MAG TPA: DUF3341 domain-containing protein [Bacteroidia bacterium]|jgi:hypothetical protein|nr:DUF3341 domain-containing protein [Bacteroidia bacterium]
MSTKAIHAIYDDDDVLVSAAKKIHASGIKVKEVFTPFPVHGLPEALHVPRTRLAICSFIYGFTALSLSCLATWYFMVSDWPMDIGGKPNWTLYHNIPAFLPSIFEFTVFCSAHLMFWTLLFRSWILPGVKPKNPDPRTTDDKFLVLIETNDVESVSQLLKETGASEIKVL